MPARGGPKCTRNPPASYPAGVAVSGCIVTSSHPPVVSQVSAPSSVKVTRETSGAGSFTEHVGADMLAEPRPSSFQLLVTVIRSVPFQVAEHVCPVPTTVPSLRNVPDQLSAPGGSFGGGTALATSTLTIPLRLPSTWYRYVPTRGNVTVPPCSGARDRAVHASVSLVIRCFLRPVFSQVIESPGPMVAGVGFSDASATSTVRVRGALVAAAKATATTLAARAVTRRARRSTSASQQVERSVSRRRSLSARHGRSRRRGRGRGPDRRRGRGRAGRARAPR